MQEVAKTTLGSIVRLTTAEELWNLIDVVGQNAAGLSHYGFDFQPESLKNFYSADSCLKDSFIYAYLDKENNNKSGIWWRKEYDPRVNKKILCEFAWVSANPKYSLQILEASLNHAKLIFNYDAVVMGNSELSEKLDNFYLKKNFKLENRIYYKS